MTIGSILLSVALLVLVGLYIFRPILTPSRRTQTFTKHDALIAEKEVLIAAIKSLDFDYETGKVPFDQYETERMQLKLAAADALRNADQQPAPVQADIVAQIEAAIAAIRNEPSGDVCDKCEAPLSDDDKFCRNCGEAV